MRRRPPPPARPGSSRIVAIGQGADADTLIALGILPVGMSKALTSDYYPWTAEALDGSRPDLLDTSSELPIEQIAALRPDLVVATTYRDLQRFQDQLEGFADVLGPRTTVAAESWQQTTLRVGEAVGRAAEARALVDEVEASIAEIRDAHPGWEGKMYVSGPVFPGEPLYVLNNADDLSNAVYSQLGLTLSPRAEELPDGAGSPGRAILSPERFELLEADVLMLVHYGDEQAQEDFESEPVFERLEVVRRGSYIVQEDEVGVGLAYASVLSIPYALERLVPQLERALSASTG